MNKSIFIGRLVADPEIRYTQGDNAMCIARYRLAVDRKFKREGEPDADFIPCIAFGKSAEFAEKYFRKGMKVAIEGRMQSGSYTNKDGVKVYTMDCIVEGQEFCESKGTSQEQPQPSTGTDGFMTIPDGIDAELPF